MMNKEKDYDRLIAETAEHWFSRSGNLLVWKWDFDIPGTCHPDLVAKCYQTGNPFPLAVEAGDPEFLPVLLRSEWHRECLLERDMPVAVPVTDDCGRMAWFIDLEKATRRTRSLIGMACMRDIRLPAWDFRLNRLAFPGASKTSVIHVGESEHFCEPSVSDLVQVMESMIPDDPERSSFTLVHCQLQGYFSMKMTRQGCIVQIRRWSDPSGLDFQHYEARPVEHMGKEWRTASETPATGDNFLPWAIGMDLALAFHSATGTLPANTSVGWVEITEDFCD